MEARQRDVTENKQSDELKTNNEVGRGGLWYAGKVVPMLY
jgi:hypothetical protein